MKKILNLVIIVVSSIAFIYIIVIGTTLIQMQIAFNRQKNLNENKILVRDTSEKVNDPIKKFKETLDYKKVEKSNNVDTTLKYFLKYINSEK